MITHVILDPKDGVHRIMQFLGNERRIILIGDCWVRTCPWEPIWQHHFSKWSK